MAAYLETREEISARDATGAKGRGDTSPSVACGAGPCREASKPGGVDAGPSASGRGVHRPVAPGGEAACRGASAPPLRRQPGGGGAGGARPGAHRASPREVSGEEAGPGGGAGRGAAARPRRP
jgi:hypothetical protein